LNRQYITYSEARIPARILFWCSEQADDEVMKVDFKNALETAKDWPQKCERTYRQGSKVLSIPLLPITIDVISAITFQVS
jgi:hypothetical protein